MRPCMVFQSMGLMPAARTAMLTCPGSGLSAGTSTMRSTSVLPYSENCTLKGICSFRSDCRRVDSAVLSWSEVVGQQAERLIEPDVVNGVPVFGGHTVFDPQEIGRGEVDLVSAGGHRAVPHAERGDPVVFGHDVGVYGQSVRHGAAPDSPRVAEVVAPVRGPAGVLDVAHRQGVHGGGHAGVDGAVVEAPPDRARLVSSRPSARAGCVEVGAEALFENSVGRFGH